MPKTQTLGEMLALKDLPLEEREQISDAIKYSAEHEGEFYTSVNKEKLDENKTSMTFMRSYLPKIDKTSERYKNGLLEGITPDAEEINEAEFSVQVKENGWYYTYTKKLVNHAWLDIKARCTKFLSNLFKTYHDEKIADAYLSSANVVTSCNLLELKDLLRLHTILYKNGAVDEGGFYFLRVAPEVGDAMVVVYKDIITHTTQKEAIIKGEIGEIAGFRIIKSRLQAFQADGSGNYPFVAYGKTAKGEYPVSIVSYDNMAEEIMVTEWGGLGNDPLKQRGAIGLYLDGHGFYVFDDAICIVGSELGTDLASYMSGASMSHGRNDLTFDDAYRSGLSKTGGARLIVPAYDYLKLNDEASEGTANTFVLSVKDAHGVERDPSTYTAESGNTSVATVQVNKDAGVTITAVAVGIATIVLTDVNNSNIKTVITVEIVDGIGSGALL